MNNYALGSMLAIVVYMLANTTLVHFQRFTFRVARSASDELGGTNRRQVRAMQSMLTPAIMASLSYLCYVLLAFSFVMAFRAGGWPTAAVVLACGVGSSVFMERGWPFPSRDVAVRIASEEIKKAGKLRHLEPEERELVTGLLMKHLQTQ
ncbi:MAG TPA: hypothetical protein VK009_30305 [Chloroflexota bacterium]|nr:hypothetical protein [Chloroflexota bacterium]